MSSPASEQSATAMYQNRGRMCSRNRKRNFCWPACSFFQSNFILCFACRMRSEHDRAAHWPDGPGYDSDSSSKMTKCALCWLVKIGAEIVMFNLPIDPELVGSYVKQNLPMKTVLLAGTYAEPSENMATQHGASNRRASGRPRRPTRLVVPECPAIGMRDCETMPPGSQV